MRLVISLLLSLVASELYADTARQALNDFLKNLNGFSARFEQVLLDADGRRLEKSNGEVNFKLPNRFHWDYQAPYQQWIIGDGQKIWVYDRDLETVTVKTQGENLDGTAFAVLAKPQSLDKHYKVTEFDHGTELRWLQLEPLNSSEFERIQFGFNGAQLTKLRNYDVFGQVTEITFSKLQINPSFREKQFSFIPPEGVDVLLADDVIPFN